MGTNMKYQPVTCVWEVTMGCNMRCGHCGSSCAEPLSDELNTTEALDLCDQIAQLGLRWITLSGGEPLTRKDIPQLVQRLHEQGVSVNIITNGWLLEAEMIEKLKESGIATVAISIDGTEKIHDKIRRVGAYEHARQAFSLLRKQGIKTGAVTTITKQNIDILPELKKELIKMGVETWQVQLGLPMGNLKERPEWLLDPEQVNDIINFCHDTAREGKIGIFPADCIGYYTKKELEIKKISYKTEYVSIWDGCNAGVRGFGILQNGDILGCTSIRSEKYIEGSIRERSLREIWEDENTFLWRRGMTKEKLSGDCKTCVYGSKCLGGCPNTRLTMSGDIYSENLYCSYNLERKKQNERYTGYENAGKLFRIADSLVKQGAYQEAAAAFAQVLKLSPEDANAWKAKGYAEYMCGNYEICKGDNEKAMEINPQDAYAIRGHAIALHRLGFLSESLKEMETALKLTGYADAELLEDWRVLKGSAG